MKLLKEKVKLIPRYTVAWPFAIPKFSSRTFLSFIHHYLNRQNHIGMVCWIFISWKMKSIQNDSVIFRTRKNCRHNFIYYLLIWCIVVRPCKNEVYFLPKLHVRLLTCKYPLWKRKLWQTSYSSIKTFSKDFDYFIFCPLFIMHTNEINFDKIWSCPSFQHSLIR